MSKYELGLIPSTRAIIKKVAEQKKKENPEFAEVAQPKYTPVISLDRARMNVINTRGIK